MSVRRDPVPIAADTRVSDVVEAYPEALELLLELGFEPLRSRIARKTVARLFTLAQAAAFRGIPLDDLLARLRRAVGAEEAPEDAGTAGGEPDPVIHRDIPRLEGDVRVLGLVPCPVRGVLTERFDGFVRRLASETGTRVAWWLAGEGPATRDVRQWLGVVAGEDPPARAPEVVLAVGTELFCDRRFGRRLLDGGVWGPGPKPARPRPELAPLRDPTGVLALQFVVSFVCSCRPDRLPGGRLPRTWADLADPAFDGHVALPSLDLPIIPDLLGALHHHLGRDGYCDLALGLSNTMHPAEASPRRDRDTVPGVVVLPSHFARGAEATGAVTVVPEEGPVVIPAFVALRADAPPEASRVVEHLLSREYLDPLAECGGFVPDRADIPSELSLERLVTRPWDTVLADGAAERSDLLIRLAHGGDIG